MPTYRFISMCTISLSTVVEAATEKEAREIAEGREPQTLSSSHYDSSDTAEEWTHSGELDGTPFKIELQDTD